MKPRSTVALSMIVKDEFENVEVLLSQAQDYFDQICVVVSDKPTCNKLKKNFPEFDIKWREWNNRFDEARNASLDMVKTDFFFWLDADDSFDFRAIPQLVDIADENDIDAIFMPYNYAQDAQGNCVTRHWRERLIRLGKGYSWRGWVHETCITDQKKVEHKVDFEIKHNNVAASQKERASYARNHAILEEAYAATKDPRYAHYLGMSYFTAEQYERAAELLSEHVEQSGNIEDTYRGLGLLSECAYHLGNFDMALEYATKCATLKPEYPMAYWLLAQYEADQDNFNEALEWVKVSETKPDPETLSVYDPTARSRAVLIAARSLFMLGRYNEALAQIRRIENMPEVQDVLEDFYEQADAETFVNLLPRIRKFFHNDESLYEALCDAMRYDERLRPLRYKVKKPVKWGDKSIVIFCGQGYEEWGPHTLDKGMGGSEEAVIYLSRELSKLGYEVTVYGEVPHRVWDTTEEPKDYNVHYLPWKEIDMRDEFNIFVSWRAPQYIEKVNAKVKLVDVHDVLPKEIVKNFPDVTYMVKSQYHSDLLPEEVDRKVVGNGIVKNQFKDE